MAPPAAASSSASAAAQAAETNSESSKRRQPEAQPSKAAKASAKKRRKDAASALLAVSDADGLEPEAELTFEGDDGSGDDDAEVTFKPPSRAEPRYQELELVVEQVRNSRSGAVSKLQAERERLETEVATAAHRTDELRALLQLSKPRSAARTACGEELNSVRLNFTRLTASTKQLDIDVHAHSLGLTALVTVDDELDSIMDLQLGDNERLRRLNRYEENQMVSHLQAGRAVTVQPTLPAREARSASSIATSIEAGSSVDDETSLEDGGGAGSSTQQGRDMTTANRLAGVANLTTKTGRCSVQLRNFSRKVAGLSEPAKICGLDVAIKNSRDKKLINLHEALSLEVNGVVTVFDQLQFEHRIEAILQQFDSDIALEGAQLTLREAVRLPGEMARDLKLRVRDLCLQAGEELGGPVERLNFLRLLTEKELNIVKVAEKLDQGWRQKSLAKIQAVTDGFPGPSKKSAKTRARAPASYSDDSSVASVSPPASVASERKAGLRRKNNKSSSGKSLSRLTRDKNFEQREAGYRSREKVQAAALAALQLQVAALSAATPAAQPHGAPYAPPASATSRANPHLLYLRRHAALTHRAAPAQGLAGVSGQGERQRRRWLGGARRSWRQ
ncbi:hypothetical protein JKP88DRAFT_253576, partial [Tribonema minus]